MSDVVKGFIDKISVKTGQTKKGKTWKLVSMQVGDVWYSCGFNNDPGMSKGDYVSFAWEKDDRDNKVVDMDSLEKATPPSAGSSPSGDGGGSQEDKDIYWAKKDLRSQVGYARAAAIDVVRIALDKEVLPWTKTAKAEAKLDLLLAMVDKVTMHFHNMTEDQVSSFFDEDDEDDLPWDQVGSDDSSDDGDKGDDL